MLAQASIQEHEGRRTSRKGRALFSTHGTWYHQKNSFKSIANIADDVLLSQIRDFFLHAMRPDPERPSTHAE